MEKIAFILGSHAIPYSGIVLSLAALGAAMLFLGLYLGKSGNTLAGLSVVPLAMTLSVLFARLLHWYCYAETYPGFLSAMTDYSGGGFGLLGVFAGCLAAAVVTRLLKCHENLPEMLDCMCLAGAAGLAVGRLASFFNSSDRGQLLQSLRSLPWAYPVTNAVSGATEYRLATFALQALVAGALFLGLSLFFRKSKRSGDTAWLFLLLYSASQVVLDSTRYDSMYFRWNGFVSIEQVVWAVTLVVVITFFSRHLVSARGFHPWYIALWVAIAACLGGAGYMEYHVQRHGSQALFAYSVMSTCLAAIAVLTLVIRALSLRPHRHTGRFLRD